MLVFVCMIQAGGSVARTRLSWKVEVQYISVPQGEPLKSECAFFLDLMAGKVLPYTDGYEARAVLEVLTAASSSMLKGERVNA